MQIPFYYWVSIIIMFLYDTIQYIIIVVVINVSLYKTIYSTILEKYMEC